MLKHSAWKTLLSSVTRSSNAGKKESTIMKLFFTSRNKTMPISGGSRGGSGGSRGSLSNSVDDAIVSYSYTVSFFLYRVRTAQLSQTQSCSQFSTCCCAVWKWSVFLQVDSLMPDDRLERKRKGSSKNRNAVWKTYSWLNVLQASKMKTKTQFQGYCQCSSWVCSLSAS